MAFMNRKEPEPMQLPAPPPEPARRQQQRMAISEQAAVAAQHVIDLEDQNQHLREQYTKALGHIAALETYIADCKRSIVDLTTERDEYKHHYTHIYTSLQNAGSILVDCMRAPPRAERNGESDERIQSVVGNLEQQLGVEQSTQAGAAEDAKAT